MRAIAVRAVPAGAARARRGLLAGVCAVMRRPARASLGMIGVLAGLAGVVWVSGGAQAAEELNLYSHRQPFLIKPFLDAFTAETGVTVNVVYASKGPCPAAPGRTQKQPGGRGAYRRYRQAQRLYGQGPAGAGGGLRC